MATYTEISAESLERFLYMFELGELSSYTPITGGIENSNYLVELRHEQKYVLTIAEDITLEQVSFFNDLLQQMVNAGLPVPEPMRTLDGMPSTLFKGKPTWLFSFLPGEHPTVPTTKQCREIGSILADIHIAARRCRYSRENVYGASWIQACAKDAMQALDGTNRVQLELAIHEYVALEQSPLELPRGTIHGDLFRDNAMFESDNLTGVIDFYHACDDYLIQDLAIAINDWCVANGALDHQKQAAMISGYEEKRPFAEGELEYLPQFRRFAAMRFALTRLLANKEDNPDRQPGPMIDLLASIS